MYNSMEAARNEIKTGIANSINKAVSSGDLPEMPIPNYTVEVPADVAHGDFAANTALVGARTYRKAPAEIAKIICANLDTEGTFIERTEIAGPGFINFFVKKEWFTETVSAVLSEGENYGKTNTGGGKKIVVEFVSANPTGPMHIGNARGGALGDCLSSLLSYAGYDVKREFYVNDAGNQIERFALSLEARYLQIYDPSVEMPENAYLGSDITEHAQNFAEINGNKYVNTSADERKAALVEFALPKNIKRLESDLKEYKITYDKWFLESTLHKGGEVDKVIAIMKEKGHTYESEGALWLKATNFGADKDFVLIRSNGIPTYIVPDIAYHYNKLITRGFDKAINVLGADHHGYKQRLDIALKALGIDTDRLDVVIYQMVRLLSGGEIIKASKRSGKAITLATLIEEVPIDAARLFFNLRDSDTHLDFDLDLAVEQSSKNPAYYIQYAYARICSIIAKLAGENIVFDKDFSGFVFTFTNPAELELIRYLAVLPDEIDTAAKEYNPSAVTKYTIELAGKFHKFYDTCRLLGEQKDVTMSRLALCYACKTVIKNMLDILKVTAPEKM